jgi:hypothetical protein
MLRGVRLLDRTMLQDQILTKANIRLRSVSALHWTVTVILKRFVS